jgi:hypothetical protein
VTCDNDGNHQVRYDLFFAFLLKMNDTQNFGCATPRLRDARNTPDVPREETQSGWPSA